MSAHEWLAWLASLPPGARDTAVEERLGIATGDAASPATRPPDFESRHRPSGGCLGEHLVGYHASGVASIVRALVEAPVVASDVLVDLGSGLGKVVLLARLLTGATARGVELQPALALRARAAADRLGIDVRFTDGDAREVDLDDGTVFFLYVPFTGPVLAEVLGRLRAIAKRRAIVVCALGVELHREARWLTPRPSDSFWLTIYDSAEPGTAPRAGARSPLADDEAATVVARDAATADGDRERLSARG